jgi:osmoprotectant transport system substrate-binding protein
MRTTTSRARGRVLGVLVLSLVLVLAACGSGDGDRNSSSARGDKESLIVGSKDFPGAQILSQVYGQALEANGYRITYKDNIGPTETVFPLLENGDIDLYGEFAGTFVSTRGGAPSSDTAATFAAVEDELVDSNVVAIGPASAQDVNGFYVLKKTAKRYDLKTVSDLTAVAPQLVFGGSPECEDRDPCLGPRSQQLYGLEFEKVKQLDVGGAVTNAALDHGDIDVAVLFTGSSVIKPNYFLLEDDKGLQSAENPMALVREEKVNADLTRIIEHVNAKLDTAAYREMALRVINDKEDLADVVADWLKRENLSSRG